MTLGERVCVLLSCVVLAGTIACHFIGIAHS